MKHPPMDLNKAEAIARSMGIRVAKPNDRIYSEGPSIILSPRTRGQSGQKDIVSHPTDSQNASASPMKSENKTPKK